MTRRATDERLRAVCPSCNGSRIAGYRKRANGSLLAIRCSACTREQELPQMSEAEKRLAKDAWLRSRGLVK